MRNKLFVQLSHTLESKVADGVQEVVGMLVFQYFSLTQL